jgi:hypothetical protein
MPWLLLIGPGIALLSLIIKFFVAIGYAVTGNFAVVPRDGGEAAVGIYTLDESGRLSDDLWIHLASGERYRGAYVPVEDGTAHTLILLKDAPREAAPASPDSTPERAPAGVAPPTPSITDSAPADVVQPAGLATLASDRGHVMRCEFAYDERARIGFGVCSSSDGKTYDVRL